MARPPRIHVPGAAYHVISRGSRNEPLFQSSEEKSYLLHLTAAGVDRKGIHLYAYCIMDNHYHLLLSDPEKQLSPFMHYLNSSYGSYMNYRRGWVGHVFAGRFKALCVERERYLAALSRSVHLNPFRAGMVQSPESYRWGSCPDYLGMRDSPPWLKTDCVLQNYGNTPGGSRRRYRAFLREGMKKADGCPARPEPDLPLLQSRETRLRRPSLPE